MHGNKFEVFISTSKLLVQMPSISLRSHGVQSGNLADCEAKHGLALPKPPSLNGAAMLQSFAVLYGARVDGWRKELELPVWANRLTYSPAPCGLQEQSFMLKFSGLSSALLPSASLPWLFFLFAFLYSAIHILIWILTVNILKHLTNNLMR